MTPCFSFDKYYKALAGGQWGRLEFESLLSLHGLPSSVTYCPYCFTPINSHWVGETTSANRIGNDLQDCDFYWFEYYLVVCGACGWHRYRLSDGSDAPHFYAEHRVAALSQSDISSSDAPLSEIRRHLIKDSNTFKQLTAAKAEDIVASVFKDYMNCEVFYTSNGVFAKDGGIDFVLVNSEQGIECAFQVKRRLSDKPEPIAPIREFIGAVAISKFNKCFYVTTASRFASSHAEIQSASSALRERRIECSLVSAPDLVDLLKARPFINLTKEHFKSLGYADCRWRQKPIERNGHFYRDFTDLPTFNNDEMFAMMCDYKNNEIS